MDRPRPRKREGIIVTGDGNVLGSGGSLSPAPPVIRPLQTAPPGLREKLIAHFNVEELRDLCYDLGIDYEQLPGTEKGGKVRELVLYCERNGRVPDLVARCQTLRPHLAWA